MLKTKNSIYGILQWEWSFQVQAKPKQSIIFLFLIATKYTYASFFTNYSYLKNNLL